MAVAALTRSAPTRKGNAAPVPRARPQAHRGSALPFGGALQTKMVLGPARDGWEREADSAAAHVMGGRPGAPSLSALPLSLGFAGTPLAQRACAACGPTDEAQRALRVQRKCACGAGMDEPCSCDKKKKEQEHPEVQIDRRAQPGTGGGGGDALSAVERVVRTPGSPLPDPVRSDMEQGFGRSFSRVRIHDDPRAAASAQAIGAHAFTVGNHIAFNRGQFQPATESGRLLLAHELAHTVQQSGASHAQAPRISQPGDRHEVQADHAATAAVSGDPMPVLSSGAPLISRNIIDDLESAGGAVVDTIGDAASDVYDTASDVASDVYDTASDIAQAGIDIASGVYDTAVAIADAIGSFVSIDGTTLVISIPRFDPCPELEFSLSLSDLGLDPTLYFPVVAGGLGIGIVDVVGVLGVEANLDPGFGFKLAGCSFGPGEIRIDPLSMSASVSGSVSVTGASMISLGGRLEGTADLIGVIAWPDPPIVLVVPAIGLSVGGTFQFMMQAGGTISGTASASMGLGGVSAANMISGDIGVGLDLAYGLTGSLSILGKELCRVGWPLDRKHWGGAASFSLSTSISAGLGGVSLSFGVSASPLPTNPLDDLGFAFDASRLEDDCWLCQFMTDNGLMPGQNGYNWANPAYQSKLTRLGGPRPDIMARDPGLKSGALCRGTCGIDCPKGTCDEPSDLVICENVGDRHVWHTYTNYATCGAHQGCKDHDACYDAAAEMPIWGFGGFMIGPMYRACDLEALCGYTFKQAVTWAGGGGPYDSRLPYADSRTVTPGCLGPCPQNVAAEGEPAVEQTCLEDRELWPGVKVSQTWGKEFFNQRLFQGFVEVPYIVGVHYGVDATARADADASAQLGPIDLKNACLIYDPATMTYSGTADLSLFANARGSASITASLEGFLSDFLCLLNWVTLRGTMNAGITVQLPTDLTVGVDLYCEKGKLHVLPRVGLETCPNIFGQISAGLDVFLLSFNVWSQEWPLIQKQIEKCWQFDFRFDPFVVGEMPNFQLESSLLAVDTLLGELFEPAQVKDIDHTPARSPLPAAPRLLFPCLGGGDDDKDKDKPTADCPRKADNKDGNAHLSDAERTPVWGATRSVSIPGGSSAAVATSMEAKFLSAKESGTSFPGGSETNDSVQRGIYKHVGLPQIGCFVKKKKKSDPPRKIGEQTYIKGHLLNAELGGPGTEEKNLFPITTQANSDHKNRVEQGGLDVVGHATSGELMYYKVAVQNPSTPQEIMSSSGVGTGFYQINATFMCEVANYQFCTDNTFKRNQSRFVPIPSQFVFHPSGGKPFDQITDASLCKR
jgi:Domain of unknown function (DUF4157)